MQTVRIEQHVIFGSEISQTIAKAIRKAAARECMVVFDFNGVEVTVDERSIPSLIYRDWDRAMQGMVEGNKVGPHPSDLTDEQKASDARIKAEKDTRRAKRDEEYRRQAAADRAAYIAALATTPVFDVVAPDLWQKGLDANPDGYGRAVFEFAEAWARFMQAEIDKGRNLADVANDCGSLADKGHGITGFQYGCAVSTLAQVWRYGPDLNRWHNAKYGRNDAEGTVNPALLTIGSRA